MPDGKIETVQEVALQASEGVVAGRPAPGAGRQDVATEIAHCPHLGLYHYRKADGEEFIFDELQLEKSIETYLAQNDARQAEFMAMLTGFARQFPHQVVSFDAEGRLNLRELHAKVPASGDEVDQVAPSK